ncbi:MAG: hypothetical protein U0573_13410 [Phycisphaerales bacterium]|nr:hypothetical protein [Planctomycetota bacterium]
MDEKAIRPVIEQELPPDFGGTYGASIVFDDRSSVVLAATSKQRAEPMGWWKSNECEICAAVFVLGIAVLLAALYRIWRRRQERGRVYCTRCNYDLTPATPVGESSSPGLLASAGLTTTTLSHMDHLPMVFGQCPECGQSAHDHPPRKGRSFAARAAPWMIVLVPIVLATGVRCARWLEFSRAGSQAWPVAWLGTVVKGWPISRLQPAQVIVHTVVPFSLARGRALPIREDVRTSTARLSADGRYLCWADQSERTRWNLRLITARLEDGAAQSVDLGGAEDGFPGLQGFTADGKAALVALTGLVELEPLGEVRVRVLTVSLDSLRVKELGAVRVRAIQRDVNSWEVPQILAAAAEAGGPDWALIVKTGPDAGKMYLGVGKEVREGKLGSLSGVPAEALFMGSDRSLRVGSGTAGMDIWAIGPDGVIEKSFAPARVELKEGVRGTELLIDGKTSATLESAELRNGTVSSSVSPDARWFAAVFAPPLPGPAVFRVWDLGAGRTGGGAR